MDDLIVGHLRCSGGNYIRLNASPFSIGKDHRCNIVCGNLSASDLHCVLRYGPTEGWVLKNYSFKGTLIDGRVINFNSEVKLNDGNIICVGEGNDKDMWTFFSNCSCTQAETSSEGQINSMTGATASDENLKLQKKKFVSQATEVKDRLTLILDGCANQAESENQMVLARTKKFEEILTSELTCSICSEVFVTPVTLNCSHTFCKLCLFQWNVKTCPNCRSNIVSESRSLVLESCIKRMTECLSEGFKTQRAQVVEERRRDEEQIPGFVAMRNSDSHRRSGRHNRS